MHDAGLIRAVAQVKGMAQLMEGFFDNSTFKFFFDICNRKAFLKSECRYDACFPGKLGFAVNMGQDWNKKVYIGNCNDLDGLRR